MATSYTHGRVTYTFQANGPIFFGAFGTVVDSPGQFGYTESDIDAAVKAFVDTLNASGHARIDTVNKVFEATGVSDWTYQPT